MGLGLGSGRGGRGAGAASDVETTSLFDISHQSAKVLAHAQQRSDRKHLTFELGPERLAGDQESGATQEVVIDRLGFAATHTQGGIDRAEPVKIMVKRNVPRAELCQDCRLRAPKAAVHARYARRRQGVVESREAVAVFGRRPAKLPLGSRRLLLRCAERRRAVGEPVVVELGPPAVFASGSAFRVQVREFVAVDALMTWHPHKTESEAWAAATDACKRGVDSLDDDLPRLGARVPHTDDCGLVVEAYCDVHHARYVAYDVEGEQDTVELAFEDRVPVQAA